MKTEYWVDKRINAEKYLANFVDIQNTYKITRCGHFKTITIVFIKRVLQKDRDNI